MFMIGCVEVYCQNGVILFICCFDAWNISVLVRATPQLHSGGMYQG